MLGGVEQQKILVQQAFATNAIKEAKALPEQALSLLQSDIPAKSAQGPNLDPARGHNLDFYA